MKTEITVPLSLVVASTATFIGNAVIHDATYGDDPSGYFAFRFFVVPAIVILLVFVPAAAVLVFRLIRHGRAVWIRRGVAYLWLIGTLLLLGLIASLAFSGIDTFGYWLVIITYFTPAALLLSSVLGLAAMFVLTLILKRHPRGTATA